MKTNEIKQTIVIGTCMMIVGKEIVNKRIDKKIESVIPDLKEIEDNLTQSKEQKE